MCILSCIISTVCVSIVCGIYCQGCLLATSQTEWSFLTVDVTTASHWFSGSVSLSLSAHNHTTVVIFDVVKIETNWSFCTVYCGITEFAVDLLSHSTVADDKHRPDWVLTKLSCSGLHSEYVKQMRVYYLNEHGHLWLLDNMYLNEHGHLWLLDNMYLNEHGHLWLLDNMYLSWNVFWAAVYLTALFVY